MKKIEYDSRTSDVKIDLSIIIPMYNVEEYVCELLNSMRGVRGSRSNIELILINNSSLDNTLGLAKEWAINNEFECLIITKENEGLAVTRNVGIKEARGDLVAFFDSDGVALSYLYDEMIRVIRTHDVDFCVVRGASFDHVTQRLRKFPDYYVWDRIMGDAEFKVLTVHQEPRIARLEPSAVVKVFKKDFLVSNNIYFPRGLLFEDISFHAQCVLNARKVALLDKTLLLYRINRDGQITSSFGQKRKDVLKVISYVIAEYENDKNKVSDRVWANLFGALIRMDLWCGQNCAFEDKEAFVDEFLRLITKLPVHIMQIYRDEYSYDEEFEAESCQAFIEQNKKTLSTIVEGGRGGGGKQPLKIVLASAV